MIPEGYMMIFLALIRAAWVTWGCCIPNTDSGQPAESESPILVAG